jgi:hypothetical protein
VADEEFRELTGEEITEPEIELSGEEPEEETGALAIMPSFQFGGRVERTGIALVHEGEYIAPAPGSEAVISPGRTDSLSEGTTWTFPVEVEVVGELSEDHLQAVAKHVFDELDIALRGVS